MQAVAAVVDPKCAEANNADGKKPYEVFLESHKELVKAGQQWIYDTANSYIAVASLVITIMFLFSLGFAHHVMQRKISSRSSLRSYWSACSSLLSLSVA
jgi:hypothetical protein